MLSSLIYLIFVSQDNLKHAVTGASYLKEKIKFREFKFVK